MENKNIVFTQNDGTVAIVTPTPEYINSEKFNFDHLVARSVPEGKSHQVIDKSEIPTDRYFRNAWVWQDKINVDMERARPIHMDKLRKIRDKKLKKMDLEYQLALEEGDSVKQQEIATKKQELRDMPQNTDLTAFNTPDELKSFMPVILE